jgi:type I restriction enzyme S subunit
MITRDLAKAAYPVKPLAEVAYFLDSRRKPVKESERKPGPYPYYGANGQIGTIDQYIFDEPLVLLAEDGGFFDNPDRGIAYRIDGRTWVNNHAHVIKPKDSIDLGYLCRVLENYDVRPFLNGSTRSKLTKMQASNIPIPLPPLEEQKRIAVILDKADELRRLRQRAIDRLNSLGQAIFHEMFGDPYVNTAGLPTENLGEICDVRDGTHDSPKYVDEGYPLLTSKNFTSDDITLEGAKLISKEDFDAINKRSKVDVGDIVMPMIGTIGHPVIIKEEPEFAIKNVALIKFKDERVMASYVHALLSGRFLEKVVSQKNRGGTQKFISLGDIRGMQIPLPSHSDQIEFERRLNELESNKGKQRESLSSLEDLFASLQNRAFQGEL